MLPESNTAVPSPCVDRCCLNDNDVCMGCFRSLQEILNWGGADSQTRLEILQIVDARRQQQQSKT
ncbi:MAG: DUF1289 domain-containing protein [Planctomycetia bacterium]|nr:DUF1289 domain-containing protein [Planctomycetia bacterium]